MERASVIPISGLKDAPQEALIIPGNRFCIRAVFRNRLRNALKHGGRGCRISIEIEEMGEKLRIHVKNSGTGVQAQERQHLFQKSSPLSRRGKEGEEGMGLGLYLVRQVLENHGGRIHYVPLRQGSDFFFDLPKGEDHVVAKEK